MWPFLNLVLNSSNKTLVTFIYYPGIISLKILHFATSVNFCNRVSRYKIHEFYSPILGPARAYKDDAHERREIQMIEWSTSNNMYDIFVPEK